MKNILKFSALAATLLCVFTACNEWTEPESLKIETPAVDPTLYADYLKNLNAYKAGSHKLMLATFNNAENGASGQSGRLSAVPDSVDYILLQNPTKIHPSTAAEFDEVHKKGMKVLSTVDFPAYEKALTDLLKEKELTAEEQMTYLAEAVDAALATCDDANLDGVMFCYKGRTLVMTPAEEEIYTARQNAYFDQISAWLTAHADKTLLFCGRPQYVLVENRAILEHCPVIVLDTDNAANAGDLSLTAYAACVEGVPTDRFAVTAMSVRPNDPNMEYGYYKSTDAAGNPLRAVQVCADWVNAPSTDFVRAGILVREVQYEYFDIRLVYRNVRQAIETMNPSPKN